MNIAIVGTGYVGLVSGACFAEVGINVTCVDINQQKIDDLKKGIIPIYEPGLDELVIRNYKEGRLKFTTDLASCINDVDVVFSAVGTPPDEDGSADLKYVLEVARTFGQNINKYAILVTKSTVPVGTSRKIKAVILEELQNEITVYHFEKEDRGYSIGGCGIEPYFTMEFDFDNVVVCWDEYKKKAWYELHRQYRYDADRR